MRMDSYLVILVLSCHVFLCRALSFHAARQDTMTMSCLVAVLPLAVVVVLSSLIVLFGFVCGVFVVLWSPCWL